VIFGAGAIFQLLVLAIFGDFSEDLFLALFSASGLRNFWRGRHFSASGLSNFWQFLEDSFLQHREGFCQN
jgi:hypothetical protein